ncbi:MAG TPA: polyphosphate kinase 2 family protein [Gemmatimonadales bacterium]|nr:polyphosphate kinase 2 family protein [Gemmatimonadales bacterium]
MRLTSLPPGTRIRLTDAEAAPPSGAPAKNEALKQVDALTKRLDQLQEALYAENQRAVLVVLQGRDTAGKDGTIRKVFGPLNPQGLLVTSFKAPTAAELAHDFLWRVHQAVPPKGAIGIFNRSHYEDVLVVRVHELVPESVWRPRYEQINQFERILTENGVTILKFFLHISHDEQRERLRARLDDPTKYWKFSVGDLGERDKWDAYTAAYEEALQRTSTAEAPWWVVPADKKYIRDLLVAQVVTETLERMDPKYPGPPEGLEELRRRLA